MQPSYAAVSAHSHISHPSVACATEGGVVLLQSCADIDSCTATACTSVANSNGVCTDLEAPGAYSCGCSFGNYWSMASMTCPGEPAARALSVTDNVTLAAFVAVAAQSNLDPIS